MHRSVGAGPLHVGSVPSSSANPRLFPGIPLVTGHYSFSYKSGPVMLKDSEISKSYDGYLITWNRTQGFRLTRYEKSVGQRQTILSDAEPAQEQITKFRSDITEAAKHDQRIRAFIEENPTLR